MRVLPLVVAAAGVLGCAGTGSHSDNPIPARQFRDLAGEYEVYVRLESQAGVTGTLQIFESDTAHGIYAGDLILEDIAFMGDVIAHSESSPRRELRTTLRELYRRRAAGQYASLN